MIDLIDRIKSQLKDCIPDLRGREWSESEASELRQILDDIWRCVEPNIRKQDDRVEREVA